MKPSMLSKETSAGPGGVGNIIQNLGSGEYSVASEGIAKLRYTTGVQREKSECPRQAIITAAEKAGQDKA